MGVRPHDLLRLASPDAIEATDAPAWVAAALAAAPWVVVRRASAVRGRIAVGVRGTTRAERFGTFVAPEMILERLSPEDLRDLPPTRAHRAFETMAQLRPLLDASGLVWGPAGAAGYELAAGRSALTADSDLDLILRADRPAAETLAAVAAAAACAPLRVDILIETSAGAVALDELLGGAEKILLRTPEGPRLVLPSDLLAAPC